MSVCLRHDARGKDVAILEECNSLDNTDSAWGNNRRIIRIGHRGAAGHAPENTLAAIRKGISLGANFVELDVQRTCDGRLVVMHDETVDRTTDGTGLVAAMTWDEVRLLDAGDGEGVPLLEAALAEMSGLVGAMLEVKAAGIGADLYGAVRAAEFSGPVIYASFLHAEIAALRGIDPLARTMALVECVPASGAGFARDAKAQMVGLDHELASADSVAMLHEAGLEVWLYTVNEPEMIRRAIDLGADGVISDYPERVPKMRG
jgi:glycerophosphoryl diester phosphodiesterase